MLPTLGPPELIIILVIVLIVFGVGRLPEVGRGLGQGIREFREGARAPQETGKPTGQTTEAENES
jgi:sec-independent protein translocase protein TatA